MIDKISLNTHVKIDLILWNAKLYFEIFWKENKIALKRQNIDNSANQNAKIDRLSNKCTNRIVKIHRFVF
jgi:hypothetical protein